MTDNYAKHLTNTGILFFASNDPPKFDRPQEWVAWRPYLDMPKAVHLVGECHADYVKRTGRELRG